MEETFALAIEEAAKIQATAEPLIMSAAFLPPQPIPLFLFSEAREEFAEPLASALAGSYETYRLIDNCLKLLVAHIFEVEVASIPVFNLLDVELA